MKQILKNTFTVTHLWGGIVPLHIFGLAALYIVLAGTTPAWWWLAALAGFFFIKFLGVGAGYHRYFSHRGFTVSRPVKLLMLWWGAVSGQGSPILWAGVHRGLHHKHSDRPGDPHSPEQGFWHSYIWWMFKLPNNSVPVRSIVDLARDTDVAFFHRHYSIILWASHLAVALVSVDLWLFLLALPALVTLHVFCLQTSVVHLRWLGYRRYDTRDDSVNCPWIWPLSMGESFHNNHHGDPKNPSYGRRWYEIDPTYWLIQLIRTDR